MTPGIVDVQQRKRQSSTSDGRSSVVYCTATLSRGETLRDGKRPTRDSYSPREYQQGTLGDLPLWGFLLPNCGVPLSTHAEESVIVARTAHSTHCSPRPLSLKGTLVISQEPRSKRNPAKTRKSQ
ncbi:hypothetical protein VTI28DRAFT_1155 [Corynascus sepedonium]